MLGMRFPLLDRLRRETASHHEALEDRLDLLRPEMTIEEYRTLLEAFYGFYLPWETRVADEIDRLLPRFSEERRKTPLLEHDLRFFGCDLQSIPQCSTLPDTDSVSGVLGSLYVLEGATLGGQILSRHFSRHFHLSPADGCSFFSSYRDSVGQRWKAFCDRLVLYSSAEMDPLIVRAAVETFRLLGGWLERSLKPAARSSRIVQLTS
jgi:heme oxygenase